MKAALNIVRIIFRWSILLIGCFFLGAKVVALVSLNQIINTEPQAHQREAFH